MARDQSPLSLEYSLLGLLKQQPGHGYDLHRRISQLMPLAFIWHIKRSKLYVLLDKLEEIGYVASEIVVGDSRPNQKRYSITEAGEQALQAWISSPVEHGRDMRQEFLARLYFAYQSGPEPTRVLLERQQNATRKWLDDLQETLRVIQPDNALERAVIEYRISQTEAMIAWLSRQRQELHR